MVWYGIVSGMIINLKVSNDGLGRRPNFITIKYLIKIIKYLFMS